jgi:hypothetical protein
MADQSLGSVHNVLSPVVQVADMDGSFFEYGLADALGSVRAEIAALKAREAELRAAILASPQRETGREFEVFVRRGTSRRINHDALPSDVLHSPEYWTETRTVTVITRPRSARARGPVSAPERPKPGSADASNDFEVIETMPDR